MFSSISSFTEGIKRLSLDTLQDEEEHRQDEKRQVRHQTDGTTHSSSASPALHSGALTTIPEQQACATNAVPDGGDEWEWDDEQPVADTKSVARRVQKQRPDSVASSPSSRSVLIPGSDTTPLAAKTAAVRGEDEAVIEPASVGVGSNTLSGDGASLGRIDSLAEPQQNIGQDRRTDGDCEQVDQDVPYSETVMVRYLGAIPDPRTFHGLVSRTSCFCWRRYCSE